MPKPFRPKAKRKQKAYVPKYRTGGYGIMLALLDIHDVGRADATQQQICRLAQDNCDSSYTLKEPNSNYTAWNSMKNLVDKGYVYKNGSPKKYQLTETGFELAEKLKQVKAQHEGGSEGGSSSTSRPRPRPTTLPTSSGAAFAAAIGSDSDDDDNGIDLSQYVLNPSQHSSITINGRNAASTSLSSNPSTARSRGTRDRFDNADDDDLSGIDWDAIDRQDQQQQRQQQPRNPPPARSTTSSRADILAALSFEGGSSSSSGLKTNKRRNKAKGKTTASIFESLLESMGGEGDLTQPDMSLYVLDPNNHQTISLNGKSATNTNTSSSRPATLYNSNNNNTNKIPNRSAAPTSTASSVTNTSNSSFARRVINETNDNSFDYLQRISKYTTPATSSILRNDASKKKSNKRQYNIDDFEMDLTDTSSLPMLSSTQLIQPSTNEIVDLLSSPESSPQLQPAYLDGDGLTFDDDFDPDKDYFPLSQSRNKHITDETFHFTYLDTDNKPQRHLAKAAIEIDDIYGLIYLIKYQTKQNEHPKAQRLVRKNVEGEFTTAYLPEIHMETVSPGLPATPILPLHREEEDSFWPDKASSSTSRTTSTIRKSISITTSTTSDISSSQATTSFTQPSSQNDLDSQPFFPSQQQKKLDLDALVAREPITETLRPDQYEIVLVLDSREIQMKGNRNYFQDNLANKGIQCITRSMDLGDVIWIARPIGSTNQAEELFLDYILERKRLDDLVSSIKDGRFIEQKTRLKRTGANKVIYVVENYNREEAERFGTQAVQTAMSSTQIIDGIFLKRTNTIDETIDYLVSATKLVKRIYQDYILHAIPGHIITRQNYLDLKQAYQKKIEAGSDNPKEAYLVSYPLFGQLNSKNGSTSVHEVYLRMLMTIRGVNAERALSLMKVYPTPRALLTAFKGKSPEEAKNLAKNATQEHISRRRWGTKISESLYDIWGALEYPTKPCSDDDEYGEEAL